MIYLDHAATTPIDKEIQKAMEPYYGKFFGNPSSLYKPGRDAKSAIEESRKKISAILNCQPEEIIFTAGGTESDNLALFGVMNQFLDNSEKYHIITSNIEHPAVLNCFKALAQKDFGVTYLEVDKYGVINPQDVLKALKPNTVLVSIMYANNEIGTIQPIHEIAQIIKNYRHIQRVDTISKDPQFPVFHTDACQAAGYLDLDIENLGADMMTLNGSKIYGPKQIGILYKNKKIKLTPMLYGGSQENSIRPGTENTASIVGFTKALELVNKTRTQETTRLLKLRDYFSLELLKIPHTNLNGHPEKRLPNNVNVTFLGVEGESVILKLDKEEIYVSTGSACHSRNLDPSHVILALGLSVEYAHGSIRFSFGKSTTKRDLEIVLKKLKKIISDLRKISAINYDK